LALVYVLTQTFCPNLILYYSISNLLVFILSQVEAQAKYGINKSLYVKHDIYRFLFLCIAFFAITSITQVSSYGFKMLIIFAVSLKWHVNALQEYNENNFSSSSWKLFGVIMLVSFWEIGLAVYD
jgi:nitrate reductase NapE component